MIKLSQHARGCKCGVVRSVFLLISECFLALPVACQMLNQETKKDLFSSFPYATQIPETLRSNNAFHTF